MKRLFNFLFIALKCTGIEYFKSKLHISLLLLQAAIFCFPKAHVKVFVILNHLLLITFEILCLCFKNFKSSFFWSPPQIYHESIKAWNKVMKKESDVKIKVMKSKEKFLQKNGKKISKICETLRKHEVSFL